MTINYLALTNDGELLSGLDFQDLKTVNINWCWVDFSSSTNEEAVLLESYFHFHPLAIEDCMHHLQRPKVDYYEGYNFYVVHSLDQMTLNETEVDLLVSSNYVVTFHLTQNREIDEYGVGFRA